MSHAIVTSVERLQALQEDWDAVATAFRSPLLEHAWFVSAAEAFGRDRLHVVTLRRAGALVAAAPLALELGLRGRRLSLLGASPLYEPGGWVYGDAEALTELAEATVAIGDPMVLDRIQAGSPIRRALEALTPHRALLAVRPTAPSLYVRTTQQWKAYSASLSSHITRNLPRVRRKAEKDAGPMRVAHLEPLASGVDEILEAFVSIEASGWKSRAGTALRHRPQMIDFFRLYCRRAARDRTLRVTTLSFGAELAAMELAVEAYNRKWQLKIAYREAFAAYYPGLQLVEASIRDAFERRLETYEFLGVSEAWERKWLPEPRPYELLAVYPLSAQGIIGACRDAAGSAWRAVHRSAVGAAR